MENFPIVEVRKAYISATSQQIAIIVAEHYQLITKYRRMSPDINFANSESKTILYLCY